MLLPWGPPLRDEFLHHGAQRLKPALLTALHVTLHVTLLTTLHTALLTAPLFALGIPPR